MRALFLIILTILSSDIFGLTGRVTTNSGQPVAGATITFVNNFSKKMVAATTNQDGTYNVTLNQSSGGICDVSVVIDQSAQKVIISFEVLSPSTLEMTLFDISGQALAIILNGQYEPGSYHLTWDYSPYKHHLENRVFFISMRSGNDYSTAKFLLKGQDLSQSYYSEVIRFNDQTKGDLVLSSFNVSVTGSGFDEHVIQNIDLTNREEFDVKVNSTVWMPFKCLGQYFGQYRGDVYKPFYVKGVNLGVGIPGTYPSQMAPPAEQYAQWFEEIADAGFNLIRVYTLHYPRFYDEFRKYNESHPDKPLYLLHGAWLDEEYDGFETNPDLYNSTITYKPDANEGTLQVTKTIMSYFDDRIREMIDVVHGHANLTERPGWASGNYTADVSPWLVGYIIGREIYALEVVKTNQNTANQSFTQLQGSVFNLESGSPTEVWAAQRLDKAMTYERDTYQMMHPISFSSWPTLDPIDHPGETGPEDMVSVNLDGIDETNAPAGYFASYHVYPYFPDFMVCDEGYRQFSDEYGEDSYLGYLNDLKSHYPNRPLIISEFGVSNGWGISRFSTNGMHHGGLTEEQQGKYIVRMMNNIRDAGCGGGMLFSWIDEWFKYVWIFGQTTNPDSRPRWHNIFSAEQNYGLITFIPGEPDFSQFGFVSHSDNISQGRVAYDTEGFYVKTILNERFGDDDTLWLALDTYNAGKGESLLPNGKVLSNRAEFCVSITRHKAQLYVTEAYSMFGIGQEGYPKAGQLFRSVPSDAGRWKEVEWRNHRDENFCGGIIFEAGNLRIRDGKNPTRHDAVIIDGNEVIVKLPWGLINFNDPSNLKVVHITDYSLYGGNQAQTDTSDGIAVTIFKGASKLTLPRYEWPKWDEYHMPETIEYKKSSYYIVRQGLKTFNQYPEP